MRNVIALPIKGFDNTDTIHVFFNRFVQIIVCIEDKDESSVSFGSDEKQNKKNEWDDD